METTLLTVLKLLTELRQKLTALGSVKWPDTREDVKVQLSRLLSGHFQRDTPAEWLAQYPRYVKAVLQRIDRVTGQYPKDQKYTVSLRELTEPLLSAQAEYPELLLMSTEATTYRWMLEEFRVSLFAQNLGTRQAVSVKRLAEQWSLVAKWLQTNPH
jgi:ATP-dependent helicase HrpA